LTTIAGSAFGGCHNLTTITVDPANTAFTAHDGMLLNKAGTTLIAYPSASGDIALPSITTVGDSAFRGCTSLTSVSLPTATTIGDYYAFAGCTGLTEVSLPAATTIGASAFPRCTSLTEVSLPAATIIGASVFSGCTGLTTVSLPAAETIGDYAFRECESLTAVSLPATPPSIPTGYYGASGIFVSTGYNSSGTITVRVPAGAVSTYISAWGVSAETAANGNTSKYGSNHKAVLITDEAQ
jgi:hypothetical protein